MNYSISIVMRIKIPYLCKEALFLNNIYFCKQIRLHRKTISNSFLAIAV